MIMQVRVFILCCMLTNISAIDPPSERAVGEGLVMTAVKSGETVIVVTFEIEPDGPDLVRLPLDSDGNNAVQIPQCIFCLQPLGLLLDGHILVHPRRSPFSRSNFIEVVKGHPVSVSIRTGYASSDVPIVLGYSSEGVMVNQRYRFIQIMGEGGMASINARSRERVPEMWEGSLVCLVAEGSP